MNFRNKKVFGASLLCFLLTICLNSTVFAKVYSYDSLNRITQVCYDNGTKTNYTYDAAGNMISSTTVKFKTLSLDTESLNMAVGDIHQIVLNATYEDGQTVDVTNDAEYSSSDSSVVSVDDFGKVTALKNGSASVTATYADKTMTVNIVVGDSTQDKSQVDANKQWTIKFNHVIDSSTVTKQNIKVLDANGQNVNVGITLGSDKKTVIVTPPDGGYKSGQTYYLNISKNLKDVNNKNLKNDTQMKFTIKQ